MTKSAYERDEAWTPGMLQAIAHLNEATKARIRRVMRAALLIPMGVGLVAGLALLVFSILVLHEGIWHELTRDVGISFLVSAWAVFGYELVQDLSKVEDQRKHLDAAARTMQEANERMGAIAYAQATGSIEGLLEHSVEGGMDKPLAELVRSSIAVVRRCRSGSPEGYPAFLKWYFGQTALSLAQLATFREGESVRKDDIQHLFSVPEPREVVARILAAEMHKLRGPPDSYDSVTNPLFYSSGRMHLFRIEIEAAADRGVKTRRIFNVSGLEGAHLIDREKLHRAKRIVSSHLDLAAKYPALYEVRFIGRLPFEEGLNHEYEFDKENPMNRHLVEAESAYFGVFSRRSQSPTYATLAIGRDPKRLSRLDLRIVPEGSATARVFEELWSEWAIDTNPFAGDEFDSRPLRARRATTNAGLHGNAVGAHVQ